MAAIMGGNDEESGTYGESKRGDEGIGEADFVEIKMAALHQKVDKRGLGALELPEGGFRIDGGRGKDGTRGAKATAYWGFQTRDKPAGGKTWPDGTAALVVAKVHGRHYRGAHRGGVGKIR